MVKVVAGIGLLFFIYCAFQVVRTWETRNGIEKTIWVIVILVGGGWCVSALGA